MSAIAVKIYPDKIEVAADSIFARGDSKRTDSGFSKLIKINDMIIGGAGLGEELSLLQCFSETHKPASASERDVLAFLVEFSEYKNNLTGNPTIINDYIIIYDKKAYCITGLLVNEVREYDAIGAGMDFADAALYLGHTPEEAVEVACALSCYVAGPITKYEIEL